MLDKAYDTMTTVCAILYVAIGGTLLFSAAIVWLSRKLRERDSR